MNMCVHKITLAKDIRNESLSKGLERRLLFDMIFELSRLFCFSFKSE